MNYLLGMSFARRDASQASFCIELVTVVVDNWITSGLSGSNPGQAVGRTDPNKPCEARRIVTYLCQGGMFSSSCLEIQGKATYT